MQLRIIIALIIIAPAALVSCNKGGMSIRDGVDTTVTIVRKWNIVSDSILSGVGLNNKYRIYTGMTSDITTLTAHRATIRSADIITPGGEFLRIVNLKR